MPKAILFVLCGILNAVIAVLYFSHAERGFHFQSSLLLVGEFTIAAGICMLAAGLWNGRVSQSYLLALSGIACTVLGLILTFWRGPVRFQTIALLIVLMAVGIGLYEFAPARVRRPGYQTARWLPAVHGLVTIAFVCAFLASGFDWIQWMRASPAPTINLLGCFFAFSAISMLGLSRIQRTER